MSRCIKSEITQRMPENLKIMRCYFSRKHTTESVWRDGKRSGYGRIKDLKVHSIDHEEPPTCFKQKCDYTILVLVAIRNGAKEGGGI